MIRALANAVMFRRAHRLVDRLMSHLPDDGTIIDIGSGTGHNAVTFQQRTKCEVLQFDVVDMHWVGDAPRIIPDVSDLPFCGDGSLACEDGFNEARTIQADCALLIYVLQYPADPETLLSTLADSGVERVLVLQSVYASRIGRGFFRFQEALFGPIAFFAAKLVGLVSAETCSVRPQRYFSEDEVKRLLQQSGLEVIDTETKANFLTGSALFVCRKARS